METWNSKNGELESQLGVAVTPSFSSSLLREEGMGSYAIIPDSGIMVAMHACMWIFHGGLEATSRFSHCGSAEWISALQVKRTSDFGFL